ncbi:MAG: YfhO family protein [Candidatus Hydrogenedentes bacterium]|nr:YfhO family protein [Candidatus Hydrogenedentota bacterium]
MSLQESNDTERLRTLNDLVFRTGIAVFVVVMAVLSIPLLTGKVYTHIDLGGFHLSARAFYQECLRNGESFLWDAQVLCGHYIHGEGQGGYLHPIHYLLYRLLPLQVAFNLELLLCYPLLLAGCYLLFRRWSCTRAAALVGAMLFTFSGFSLLRAGHIHLVEMTVHLPWLLWAIDRSFTATNPRARAWSVFAVALLTGSELLIGYPQFAWIIGLAEGVYTLSLTVKHKQWVAPLHLFLAKVLGFLIGAGQWLPSYEFLRDSDRMLTAGELRNYLSVHPLNLLQMFGPYTFEFGSFYGNLEEFTMYTGAACTILLIWGLFRLRHLGSARMRAIALCIAGIIVLLTAFGTYTGFHELINWLPLVSYFKGPCRYLVLFFFFVAALAALGFDDLLRVCAGPREGKRRSWTILAVLVLASWLIVGAAYLIQQNPDWALYELLNGDFSPPPLLWWGPVAMSCCAVLALAALRGYRIALPLLIVVAAGDQALYGLHFLYWWDTPTTIERFAARYAAPDDVGEQRLFSSLMPQKNGWTLRGLSLANGFAGIVPRQQLVYNHEAAWRAAGVAYREKANARYFTNDHTPGEPDRWIPVSNPVPRVYLVSKAIVSNAPDEDIRHIDLATTALVERSLTLNEGGGDVRLLDERHGRVRIQVQTETPQLLIFDESFHRGWKATAFPSGASTENGTPLEILRVNGDFMGVALEPGTYEVQFEFDPESFRNGVRLSLVGIGLSIVHLAIALYASSSK